MAEVAAKNAALQNTYSQIDGLLAATLDSDDWVNLEDLRIVVEQPAFDPGRLAEPAPLPPAPNYPPEPTWREPEAPRGLTSALGGKKRHEAQVAHARSIFERDLNIWRDHTQALYAAFQREYAAYEEGERQRLIALSAAQTRYQSKCLQREEFAAEQNAELDRFINELAFDMAWAIQEYVDIVLSQSVYPECFPVEHDHRFDLETRELTVTIRVPEPTTVPTIKEYRYVKAKDEIASTTLAVKDQKERYASAVGQVALRTLHEIFEADRVGRIHSIALTVESETIDAATGSRHRSAYFTSCQPRPELGSASCGPVMRTPFPRRPLPPP